MLPAKAAPGEPQEADRVLFPTPSVFLSNRRREFRWRRGPEMEQKQISLT